MSTAGKEVLIKPVVQGLPNYVMSISKVPGSLCEDLMKQIRAYWWGARNGCRKVQWIPWDTLTKPKLRGGLGFRDLKMVNKALPSPTGLASDYLAR